MTAAVLGKVTCPHCRRTATVHQTGRSKRLLYYRCGEVYAGASTGCGTVQVYGASGQAWITANMVPDAKGPAAVSDPVVDPVPDPVSDVVSDPVPDPVAEPVPKRKGIFQQFAEGFGDL